MIGALRPAPDRRNGATFALADVSTLNGPSLPCCFFVWQDVGGGPQEYRAVRVPPGPDAHAPGRLRARDRALETGGAQQPFLAPHGEREPPTRYPPAADTLTS